jgi:hypothetical protein
MNDEEIFNDFSDALWYLLKCHCQTCGVELELLDWERLKLRDPPAWARLAAKKALEQGWTASTTEIAVRCPTCSSQRAVPISE